MKQREIKFRGKCLQSGELVFGDLIHGVGTKAGKTYILPNRINLAYVKHCDPLDGVMVDPDTVGQYTGLKDKNGKEIYESDWVKDGNGSMGVVEYNSIGMMFEFQIRKYENEGAWQHPVSSGFDGATLEVIGNIYEGR